ncbi:MAG: LysR family transcriptional regulator [Nocardioidaceae bacterium]
MDLRQFQYAVAVADELHFGRAAERLHVAQPSLSRQIRDLERDLGVDLFTRTSRHVELTPAGSAFVGTARRAIALAALSRESAVAAANGVQGRVSLGFVASAAVEILPQLVAAHRAARPLVRLSLHEMTTEEQIAGLMSGDIDVGLSRDLEATPGLRVQTLRREPLIAAIPSDHPLQHRRRVSLADLAGSAFVTLPRQRVPRAWDRLLLMAQAAQVRPSYVQEANQFVTLLALVAAGLGVAVVPESVRTMRHEGVHYARLRDAGAWSEITSAVRADEHQPVARDLHELLRANSDVARG